MKQDIKILIVDDEEIFISILQYLLSPVYNVFVANNGRKALEMAKKIRPDLILLDVIMPDISGFDVLAELKKDVETQDIPVIFITGLNSTEEEERGFFLGAIDYITKPFVNSIVMARVRTHVQILNHIRTIEQSCMIDALTNLPNRRSFDERLSLEWDKAIRENQPLSLLFIDMDKFKHYNDTYGHPFGDLMIQKSGEIYRKTLKRGSDFVARWGGDEFVILLPNTDFAGACEVASQISKNISAETIHCANGDRINATISVGVNTVSPSQTDLASEFLAQTDKALYAAKAAGRNRYCSYEDYLQQQSQQAQEAAAEPAQPLAEELPLPVKSTLEYDMDDRKAASFIGRIRNIKSLDVDQAIAAIGGSVQLYEKILTIVIGAFPQNIEQLDTSLFTNNDLRMFSIVIHGMKGSLRQIGSHELARQAEMLYDAAKAGNREFCLEKYPVFKKNLLSFYERAQNAEQESESVETPLPMSAENTAAKEQAAAEGTLKKILVVDDNVANLTLIKGLLDRLYSVHAVNSGETALRFLKKHTPNLILLDVEMPNMGGKEVLSAIQDDPALKDIPVIFLTGLNDMESEAEAFKLGIADYIHKPVNDVIMLHRVKMQLEMQDLRNSLENFL